MTTIHDLSAEWLAVLDMAEDPDVDEQAIRDTLEGIEGEIEAKADNYAVIINELKADAEKLKAEETRIANRRRGLENRAEYLKRVLTEVMYLTGKTKFKTALYSFGIQKNPPTVVIDTADLDAIPKEYLVYSDPTINKKQMLVDMRSGKDLDGIAHLAQGESLRIR